MLRRRFPVIRRRRDSPLTSLGTTNLKQEILKIVIDKFLIGVILVGLGIFATNLVESLKNERSFALELNKTRVTKMSEVWEKLYLYEATLDSAMRTRKQRWVSEVPFYHAAYLPNEDAVKKFYFVQKEHEREVAVIMLSSEVAYRDLTEALHKNRFWLGDDDYFNILEYTETTNEYITVYGGGDEKPINDLSRKREILRADVTRIRNRLLKE